MEYAQIKQLNSKLYFTLEDFIRVSGIKKESASVLCSRYVKKGEFIRLKNNFYLTAQKWDGLKEDDFLRLANFLQVPSYISFMSALWLYEVTTQVPRNFYESASVKRSGSFEAQGAQWHYYKLKKELYFGFVKKDGVFVATAEKALLDVVYLYSFGKYKLDMNALDLDKLDKKKIFKISREFPVKTRLVAEKLCRI